MQLKEIVRQAMSYTTQHQDKEDYHDYVCGAMQRMEVHFDAVSTLEIKRLIAEIKQESTEMIHKQMVQHAVSELQQYNHGDCSNKEVQEFLSTYFYVELSTGEISDIRNKLDSEKTPVTFTIGEYVKPKTSQEIRAIRRHIGTLPEYECSECNCEITLQESLFNQGHCDACQFS